MENFKLHKSKEAVKSPVNPNLVSEIRSKYETMLEEAKSFHEINVLIAAYKQKLADYYEKHELIEGGSVSANANQKTTISIELPELIVDVEVTNEGAQIVELK